MRVACACAMQGVASIDTSERKRGSGQLGADGCGCSVLRDERVKPFLGQQITCKHITSSTGIEVRLQLHQWLRLVLAEPESAQIASTITISITIVIQIVIPIVIVRAEEGNSGEKVGSGAEPAAFKAGTN